MKREKSTLQSHVNNSILSPFVKWEGGKRQLLPDIKRRLPTRYGRYIEPFVGGGAVCFALAQSGSLINDKNPALIHTYHTIQQHTEELIATIRILDDGIISGRKEYYYEKRARYNEKLRQSCYDTETAALFIFMNKHCFNGLYRVNRHGAFNVPYNGSIRTSMDEKNIRAIAAFLDSIEITQGDFEIAAERAEAGDFVFFDSPYAPLNPTSFEAYTKEGFERKDHERLASLYRKLTKRGCYCMLTNHNTEFIRTLYDGFHIAVVTARRAINSDASKRTGEEVIICNYETSEEKTK